MMNSDKKATDGVSSSPREDYDPLLDDLRSCDLADESSGSGSDTPGSSFGHDQLWDKYSYGVTPPVNQRERKLTKERARSSKGKVVKLSQKMKKDDKPRPSHREQPQSMLPQDTCDITLNDSGADEMYEAVAISKTRRRKESGKSFSTTRAFERDFKSNSSDRLVLDGSLPTASGPVVQPVVDSPRYLSLQQPASLTTPVSASATNAVSPKQHRRSLTTTDDCPLERIKFYQTFSMLINLGSKKDKEKEGAQGNLKSGLVVRQMSSEQESWLTQLNDLLWLELQSWHSGKSMKDQDLYLCKAREFVPAVLEKVIEFQFSLDGSNVNQTPVDDNLVSLDIDWHDDPHGWPQLHQRVEEMKKALVQVESLLCEIEAIEALYPSFKALQKEYPLYASEAFQNRMETLCLWLNITRDLGSKLQLMGHILYIDKQEDIHWPWMDYQHPPGCSAPSVEVTNTGSSDSETEQEDDDDDDSCSDRLSHSQKNVRFDIIDNSPSSPDSEPTAPFPASSPTRADTDTGSFPELMHTSSSCQNLTRTSIYRQFVDRILKRMGLRKAQMRLRSLLQSSLARACSALSSSNIAADLSTTNSVIDVMSPTIIPTSPSTGHLTHDLGLFPSLPNNFDLPSGPESWLERLNNTGLPSFRPLYLFLVRIPLDVIHECIRLRIEQRPETEPSLLSVRQLIRECKEVLIGGVMVKQYWRRMAAVVQPGDERQEASIEDFEIDLKLILEVYFNYLQTWMSGLEALPEMSKRLKNFLEDEWNFTKRVCRHVRGGEALAGKRFCLMASSLLRSISDFLDTGVDSCINQFYDSIAWDSDEGHDDDDDDNDDEENEDEGEEYEESDEEAGSVFLPDHSPTYDASVLKRGTSKSSEMRQYLIQCCRRFKLLFREARERASKALGFVKMLRKDLEIAADFSVTVSLPKLLKEINDTRHVRLVTPHRFSHLMFIPASTACNSQHIVQLLNMTCGREDSVQDSPHGTWDRDAYLLLVKTDVYPDDVNQMWRGATVKVEPDAETSIALSHMEVESLLLVVTHSSLLSTQRTNLQRHLGSAVELVNEQTSCHQAITESLLELKAAGLDLREKIAYSIRQVDDKLSQDRSPADMEEVDKLNITTLYRETLHQCYNFGFEYHKEVIRLVSGETRQTLGLSLVSFAKQWMKFVSEKCERGRGRRPRWANQGLEFLILACEPRVMASLTDHEFSELKKCINDCITHVIGHKGAPTPHPAGHRVSSPDVLSQRHQGLLRNVSCPDTSSPRTLSLSTRSAHSEPSTPFTRPDTGLKKSLSVVATSTMMTTSDSNTAFPGDIRESFDDLDNFSGPFKPRSSSRLENVRKEISHLEQRRAKKLFNKHVIGRPTSAKCEVDYHINIRRVNFKWQRGYKIGEGQFGKVYAAVNTNTGQLMAMKELKFQPNDLQTIKDIADEIKIFETISHPSLVQYYGVEVHRDDMLIFMEYCSEGTVEEVSKLGIPEALVRKYSCEILMAIQVLHENGIVHRDIKGANIFLTSDGPVKLGDFGCSVKLKNHTTMPGEVANTVGTTAYMAPEVISQDAKAGSGRAADIWSLGCVVIEMATGKRPWHELENNYQIMFKVGMGGRPPIPECLSLEGKDFLSHCLEQDPKLRWTASQLQDHTFVKVSLEEDMDSNQGHD